MILHIGNVVTVRYWEKNKDRLLDGMRKQIAKTATTRDLVLSASEEVEIVEIAQHPDGTWYGTKTPTHIKVTIEMEAEHA